MMKRPKKDSKKVTNLDQDRVDDFIGNARTVVSGADAAPRRRGGAGKRVFRPKGGFVRATYDIPADLHDAVKRAALDQKRPMRDMVVEWIESGLKKAR